VITTKQAATLALADHHGPAYLRFGRPVVANFTPADEPFVIGKAIMLSEGTDVTIVATGHLVWEALIAAEALKKKGISAEVINIHTIKPLDEEAILKSLTKKASLLLKSTISWRSWRKHFKSIGIKQPSSQEFVVLMTVSVSLEPAQLMENKLNNQAIVEAVERVVKRK
jgi:transketolase